jgi:uncharacterized membrane protein
MRIFLHILIIFAAFCGFLLAFYIRHKKRGNEKLVCPIGSDCDTVIHSEYAKFLGFPVEVLGLFYYGGIALAYGAFLAFPFLASPVLVFMVFGASIAAFFFSLYLTFIQAFALKQWCAWCLTSAGLCTGIFAAALFVSEAGFLEVLAAHHSFLFLSHMFGVALGLGGATIADIFFFKFLRDFKISEWEADILHTLSQIIWFALAILLLSGAGLYVLDAAALSANVKFIAKMTAVLVIIANGALLNLLIAPKLVKISFGEAHAHMAGELRHIRKIAFALGAISLVSWYAAFLFGFLADVSLGATSLFGAYAGALALAVLASQLLERLYAGRATYG